MSPTDGRPPPPAVKDVQVVLERGPQQGGSEGPSSLSTGDDSTLQNPATHSSLLDDRSASQPLEVSGPGPPLDR